MLLQRKQIVALQQKAGQPLLLYKGIISPKTSNDSSTAPYLSSIIIAQNSFKYTVLIIFRKP